MRCTYDGPYGKAQSKGKATWTFNAEGKRKVVQSTHAEGKGKVKAEIYVEESSSHDAEEIGTKS